MKTEYQKDICTPMFSTVSFTIAKLWKLLKCLSMDEWIKKIHSCTSTMKYYSAMRKKEILPFAAPWIDLRGIMLREINQRKTNTKWYHLYVEFLLSQTYRVQNWWSGPRK